MSRLLSLRPRSWPCKSTKALEPSNPGQQCHPVCTYCSYPAVCCSYPVALSCRCCSYPAADCRAAVPPAVAAVPHAGHQQRFKRFQEGPRLPLPQWRRSVTHRPLRSPLCHRTRHAVTPEQRPCWVVEQPSLRQLLTVCAPAAAGRPPSLHATPARPARPARQRHSSPDGAFLSRLDAVTAGPRVRKRMAPAAVACVSCRLRQRRARRAGGLRMHLRRKCITRAHSESPDGAARRRGGTPPQYPPAATSDAGAADRHRARRTDRAQLMHSHRHRVSAVPSC